MRAGNEQIKGGEREASVRGRHGALCGATGYGFTRARGGLVRLGGLGALFMGYLGLQKIKGQDEKY